MKIQKSDQENILAMLAQGDTYAKIGNIYGVSRERIRQIAQKNGLHRVGIDLRRAAREEEALEKKKSFYGEFFDGNEVVERELVSICKEKFRYKKYQAKTRGIPFEVDFQDIKWNKVCPILGVEIDYFAAGVQIPSSASFDRVDHTKGYVKGNVQIISMRANIIKNDGSAEEHMKIAEYILKNSANG